MTTDRTSSSSSDNWDEIGQAAINFARRIAKDTSKFAERIEEHAGGFARDVTRDWHRARRHYRHRHCESVEPSDVKAVFEDVKGMLSDVLESVEEFIGNVFSDAPPAAPEEEWIRVVANREVICCQCASTVDAGDSVDSQRHDDGMRFRCLNCTEASNTDTAR